MKKFALFGFVLLVALFASAASVNATRHDVQGLVFMEDNLNGVWDVGEAGYNGEWQWIEDDGAFRFVGATVTILTPAYDEFEVETLGYREFEEGEDVFCTQQDLVMEDGELNSNPVRPCAGTWGIPVSADDTYLQISITPPEGYTVTSSNPQYCVTGDDEWMDFGIAPMAGFEAEALESVAAVAEEAVAVAPSFHMTVEGTGFVPGLVFMDDNLNGVWDVGEAGYGGELLWDEGNEIMRYVGATITFISPAYDKYTVEAMGYRELEEGETMACAQQDLVIDGEINASPVRPCSGTFGLTHAGDDVRWEVVLTVPKGYTLTTENPQYYTTGSGQMPVDFGIAPVTD
jgi:hypothetical protein